MQFQVPQFIETEDKIVGPLSLRQFLYVGAGVGLSSMLFFVLQTWLWAILSFIIVGASAAIAFVKIGGRPFISVALSAFNFYWKPQTYVWQPEHPVIAPAQKEKPKKAAAFPLENILAPTPVAAAKKRADLATGTALHKNWEDVQVGKKVSAKQFTEQKMSGRYEIFRKLAGDREAARRVDYR
jgi:hypothetical protein